MSERNTIVRSLHDLGLAVWFGGALAGAVAVNGAAGEIEDKAQRLHVANAGWARWTPVNLVAIGAHLIGAAGLLTANKGRVVTQRDVGTSTVIKAALTVAALGATATAAHGARSSSRLTGLLSRVPSTPLPIPPRTPPKPRSSSRGPSGWSPS